VHLTHDALAQLCLGDIDSSELFLSRRIRSPLFISCMTGGSEGGFAVNRELARAASAAGIPVGMGSIRVLFEHPELRDHFHLRPLAREVPIMANLGIVQVRDREQREIVELVRRLEADCLVVHLNPAQELFQPGGDRDFRGTREALGRLCASAPFPVIVKETGFGIHPKLVLELLGLGVAYVDLAGAGGTNWVSVEARGGEPAAAEEAEEFRSWGLPTGLLLASLEPSAEASGRLLASGGIRSGMDVARCLALGAHLVGMALPLARAVVRGGAEEVLRYLERVERTLRRVMLLTGSRDLVALRRGKVWLESRLVYAARALSRR
jgi:isopentenyl-diphosphate delta-isomerase